VSEALLGALTGRGPALPVVAFALVAAGVLAVAARLSRDADAIAEATGLGRLWIGSVVLAASTSLPELLTNVNAALLDEPDIGVGDLLGAVLANMLVLAVLDVVFARRRILQRVALDHAVVGVLGILLAAMAGSAIYLRGWASIGHVGVETVAIAAVYAGAMRQLYRAAAGARAAAPAAARASVRRPALRFALGALGLALLAPLLVLVAEAVADETGVSTTVVGTLLVGLTTTLPETAATVAAVRVGALDLAVGNVFGSNAFNMVVLLVLDVVSPRGPILAVVAPQHAFTVLVAVACTALGLLGILLRAEGRRTRVPVASVLVVAAYVAGVWALARVAG
jgi:cation:H+ antiporter